MKAASSTEIKAELREKTPTELIDICLRLVRFKKENKELLSFLLFYPNDIETYIDEVKKAMEFQWATANRSTMYFTVKSVRKLLRLTNRYIRYTGSRVAEVELLLYFCGMLHLSGVRIHKSTALTNLYGSLVKKIRAAMATLHEDLQHDYKQRLQPLLIS
jgi:hypothetical protein